MGAVIEIDYSPFPYQEEYHLDDHRFRIIVAGRRAGKSVMALMETIAHCLSRPNAMAWWVAPTYKDAKEIGWEELERHLETLKPAISYYQKTNLKVQFKNGSKLYFKGSDKFDSLRGRGLTWCVIDEAAFCHEDTWKKAIRPALSDKQGRATLITTPNGHNWFKELFHYADFPSTKSWRAWHFPSSYNPLLTAEDLEAAKHELSEMDYRQEYLAEFITKAGLIYDDFSDENIQDLPLSEHVDIYLGADFGYANPTAICFIAVDRATGFCYQFDELYVTRTPIDEVVDMIYYKLWQNKVSMPLAVMTDPAGNAEELTSGLSPVDFLRNKHFTVVNKGSKIAPGLALVRSYIKNAADQRRFLINPRCVNTIKSLRGYSYKLGPFNRPTEEPDKDNIHDHLCDALRYFFVNKFDHAKYLTKSLDQYPYLGKTKQKPIMKRCGICKKLFPSKTPKDQPPLVCNECAEK